MPSATFSMVISRSSGLRKMDENNLQNEKKRNQRVNILKEKQPQNISEQSNAARIK